MISKLSIYNKKFKKKYKYKFICSLFILLHVFGASWVSYYLIFNVQKYKMNMNHFRQLLGFDYHNHELNNIFKTWLLSIQIKYIIADLHIYYKSLTDYNLLLHTIQNHGLESFICCVVFFLHNEKDYFIFGITCFIWLILWIMAYFTLYRKNKFN